MQSETATPFADRNTLRLLLESVPEYAIFALDAQGHIASWNAGAERIKGYSEGEALGKHISIFYVREDLDAGRCDRALELAAKDGRFEEESWRVRKGGARFFASVIITALRDPDGALIGFGKVTRDLTRTRQQAEERMRLLRKAAAREATERALRAVLDSVPELAWSALPDGRIDFYNQRWFDYTGTTFEEMQGLGWEKVHQPERLPEASAAWQRSLATGEPFEMEFPLRGRDGVFHWFLARVQPIRDSDGQIIRWFGSNANVDELKELREAQKEVLAVLAAERASLKISEERLSAIFKHSPLPLAVSTIPSGQIADANEAFERLFESSREELLGKTSLELGFGSTEAREEVRRRLNQDGVVRGFETVRRTRAGKEVVLSLNVTPVHLDGQPHVITAIEDITRRKQHERDLLQAKEDERRRLYSLLEALPAHVNFLKGPEFVFEYVHPSVREMLGERDVAGRAVLEAIPEYRDQPFMQRLRAVYETGEGSVLTEQHKVLDLGAGPVESFWHSVYQPVFDASGQVEGVMTFDLEVTEQVRSRVALERSAEVERSAREKAEHATRLKDEFLSTLSHELRTPLNAILGWSRLLQSGQVTADKQQAALDAVVRNAIAQNRLIDDLLDLSSIISGKLRLSVDWVDPACVVDAALEIVKPAADAKGIRLQTVLDTHAGSIQGDAGRLQQVFWNLLGNAVKFTPRNGRVHVSLRRVDSHVEVTVSDSGSGIARSFLPYVFDRFRQEDGAITRKTGGLGLGLSIVKSIVELHGGTVEAHSGGEGHGATFTVKIPIGPVHRGAELALRAAKAAPGAPKSIDCPAALFGLNVLVVDDDGDARGLLRSVLEHCQARVRTASSSAEALEMIGAAPPDVIVSDIGIGMPDEDGYTFVRKLRGLPPALGGRIPAVALTAYARPEDRRRALVEGFQSHASKPIDPQELVIVIASLVGRYS